MKPSFVSTIVSVSPSPARTATMSQPLSLALHVEAGRLQEALDGRIERGFGHEGTLLRRLASLQRRISKGESPIP